MGPDGLAGASEQSYRVARCMGADNTSWGRRKADETTWIAIGLVDESDPPKPVPFKRCRIELPDFSVREGRLDQDGQAKIVGIDPGMYQVTFLDHDASEWRGSMRRYRLIAGARKDMSDTILEKNVYRADFACAALFRFRRRFPGGFALTGEPDPNFVDMLRAAVSSYRHPWAVSRGMGTLSGGFSRGAGFIGHLHDCLQRGSFP